MVCSNNCRLIDNMERIGKIAVTVCAVCSAVFIVIAVLLIMPWHTKSGAFEIKKGESISVIGTHLAETNAVLSRPLFMAYARLSGNDRRFRAGTYDLPNYASAYKLTHIFSTGKSRATDSAVTIFEGTNLADLELMLVSRGIIQPHALFRSDTIR